MIRFRSRRFNDLDRPLLLKLQGLTNDVARGDQVDGNHRPPGSVFRNRLDARLMGERFPEDCWATVTYDWLEPVAWSLLTRHLHGPDGEPLSFPTASAGFYVHPTHRRTGLGTRLVQRTCEVARKNGIHRLLVNPWNESSLSFFQSNGFELVEAHDTWWRCAAKDLSP